MLGLVEIPQTFHATIRALAIAFLELTGVNERERPMRELELVQFRQPLRAGEIRGLTFFAYAPRRDLDKDWQRAQRTLLEYSDKGFSKNANCSVSSASD